MNLNQILNMVLKIVTRRAMQLGMNKAIDLAATRGKSARQMTPEDKMAAQQTREAVKRARQAARITRRFMR